MDSRYNHIWLPVGRAWREQSSWPRTQEYLTDDCADRWNLKLCAKTGPKSPSPRRWRLPSNRSSLATAHVSRDYSEVEVENEKWRLRVFDTRPLGHESSQSCSSKESPPRPTGFALSPIFSAVDTRCVGPSVLDSTRIDERLLTAMSRHTTLSGSFQNTH